MLTYVTPPLTDALRISGAPTVNLVASTSGTDSDWVVKLIDVYPEEVPSQLGTAMDIFRGRYRESFDTPKAVAANTPLPYTFILPTANHVFLPGHSDHGAGVYHAAGAASFISLPTVPPPDAK